ncbi:UDP-N-acetylmuramoyl-L-alanine--D-glutamate ligase, partial [Candidatus Uhrbacteria bacterium]|nr:UDP-N-acetylmuramoyl-L-alanine--D-glutamate ligase [Candidatus Uhrbacteria bacterium]
ADQNEHLIVPEKVTAHLGSSYLQSVHKYDVIVRSPGVRYWPELLAVQERVTTATQLFFEEVRSTTDARIIAVTGTKGKSTTSTLIHKTLEAAGHKSILVGNIERQDWDMIDSVDDATIIVYEMSSYMLADFTQRPDIAVMMNVHPCHVDWHGTFEAYVNAKGQVTAFQGAEDVFVFNATYPELVHIAQRTHARAIPFKHMQTMHHDGEWFYDGSQELFETARVKILGRHNRDNVLAVLTVAKLLNINADVVRSVVEVFEGLPHRLELVATVDGVSYYDDAIASNPDATIAALHTFGSRIGSIILGGKNTGFEFNELAHIIKEYHIPYVVLLPGSRAEIKLALEHANYTGVFVDVENMQDAVRACQKHTKKDSVALLSTATPSYDLFKNYKDQGDQFKAAVLALKPTS